jgi:4'-phosphopantetheinyl transferase EntD
LLAALFPPAVQACELRQPGDPALLHAEELAPLREAVAKRVGEYAAGRLCARAALAGLGIVDFPLRIGADRRPQWPPAVVGSITHTHGYAGAVVAPAQALRAIGVDTEVIGRVKQKLWPKICTPQELDWLTALPAEQRERCGALLFSAKEAFYKCQFGLTAAWVGFHDVYLELEWDEPGTAGVFHLLPLTTLVLERHLAPPWNGRFRFENGLVAVGMSVSAI